MICCQFIFKPGTYDEEFTALDNEIDAFAKSLDGYIGVDRWYRSELGEQNSIYYFTDVETVHTFSKFPEHLTAKREYARWYDGYQIVISEVTVSRGDGRLEHIVGNWRPERS